MLNGVPFGSAGRVVSDGDGETETVAQFGLNLGFPCEEATVVAAASVRQYEQFIGARVTIGAPHVATSERLNEQQKRECHERFR